MGMQKGVAKGFGKINQNITVKVIISIAIFAAGILILTYFIDKNWLMYIALGLGIVCICGIYYTPFIYSSFETLINKFFAFCAALRASSV